MPQPKAYSAKVRYPLNPPGILPLIWFLVAIGCSIFLAVWMFDLVRAFKPVERVGFTGELVPNHDFVDISLPSGAILDTILVSPGDRVISGETVALLNLQQMGALKGIIGEKVTAHKILLACLTKIHSTDKDSAFGEIAPDPTSEHQNLAWAECLTYKSAAEELTTTHDTAVALHAERSMLLARQIENTVSTSSPSNSQRTKKVIGLAMARNSVDLKIERERSEYITALSELRLKAHSRMEKLSASLTALTLELTNIESNIQSRRLTSPVSGEVIHVRRMKGKEVDNQTHSIIRLRYERNQSYEAFFLVPYQEKAAFKIGQIVEIDFPKIPGVLRSIAGKIASQRVVLNASSQATVLYRIEINSEAMNSLEEDLAQYLLNSPSSSAEISVRGSSEILSTALSRELGSFQFRLPWLSSFLVNFNREKYGHHNLSAVTN